MIRGYRGIARNNLHYQDAVNGIARPKGGTATPDDHNDGDTNSIFTSWTTNWQVAKDKALDRDLGGWGVVLQKDFHLTEIVASPDAYFESEFLVRGLVTDAFVIEVY